MRWTLAHVTLEHSAIGRRCGLGGDVSSSATGRPRIKVSAEADRFSALSLVIGC